MGRVVTNMKERAVPMGHWLSKAAEVGCRILLGQGLQGEREEGWEKKASSQAVP